MVSTAASMNHCNSTTPEHTEGYLLTESPQVQRLLYLAEGDATTISNLALPDSIAPYLPAAPRDDTSGADAATANAEDEDEPIVQLPPRNTWPDFLTPFRRPQTTDISAFWYTSEREWNKLVAAAIVAKVPNSGVTQRLKRLSAVGLIMEVEGVGVLRPCKWCIDRGYPCTVFIDKIKGNVCAFCKRNGKSYTAGESRRGDGDATPLVSTEAIIHQISVSSGAAIAATSITRQLVQTTKEKDEEMSALVAGLRQDVRELRGHVHRLQDTVVGQQRLIDKLIERMDKVPAVGFRNY